MARDVVVLRGSTDEKARWDAAAESQGLTFSAYARRSLNESTDLIEAEQRRVSEEQQRRESLRQMAFPQEHRCPPKGVYCKSCGEVK